MVDHSFIRARRKALHMTLEDLAQKIGVNKSTIQRYESNGIETIPQKRLFALCTALHCDLISLLGLKEAKDPSTGRAVPLLQCGAVMESAGFYFLDPTIAADFCLQMKGDSMIGARIYDGDIVFLRRQDDVNDGEIAAVILEQETVLKRVYKLPGRILLRSENLNDPPLDYPLEKNSHIQIIGKAIAFQSRLVSLWD